MDTARFPPRPPRAGSHRRVWLLLAVAGVVVPITVVAIVALRVWTTTSGFADYTPAQPSRLYAAPLVLQRGAPVDRVGLLADLRGLGFRETASSAPAPGEMATRGATLLVALPRVPLATASSTVSGGAAPGGAFAGSTLALTMADGRIAEMRANGRDIGETRVPLGRPLLYSFVDERLRECRPVRIDDLPPHVVNAVLAAEDAGFFTHRGVSPWSIARAALVNLRSGHVEQGGSTITQQLAWNLYLSHERTFQRKAHEAALAMVLEARYSKRRILEAYLNEIYWGNAGGANLHGIGAAARAYFGKDASQLSVAEAATLAGMIPSPASFSPLAAPAAAHRRRDWVLAQMEERGFLSRDQARVARAQPLVTHPMPLLGRRAPWFAVAMADEARQRFHLERLGGSGHVLLSTLSSTDQWIAERQVARGLRELERSFGRADGTPLESALVSLDPRSGAVLAWVGGRDFARGELDHVTQARRQPGSAFKPFVYAAALADGRLAPWELLDDAPIAVREDRTVWRPRDSDGGYHGQVTPADALAYSLNLPTVRVALRAGLPRIAEVAHALGIDSPLATHPSLALGACEVTPLEMAVAYSTLASSGLRPQAWGLAAIRDARGDLVAGDAPATARRAIDADTAYEVTSLLRGVLDRGTGAAARAYGLRGALAGKTGTTDDRRDSWFAGYATERVTVVWVGHDDNTPTRLSGARAALPLWSRFMAAVGPRDGYAPLAPPSRFVTVDVDPTSGMLATPWCARRVRVELPIDRVPLRGCDRELGAPVIAAGGFDPSVQSPGATETLAELLTARGDAARPHRGGEAFTVVGEGGQVELRRGRGPTALPRLGVVDVSAPDGPGR